MRDQRHGDAAGFPWAEGTPQGFAQLQDGREDARALFRLVKERRYGAGCVEAWRRDADALSSRLAELLAPVAEAVARHPFLLGQAPTLADAAGYGQLVMVESGAPGWSAARLPALRDWWERLAAARAKRRA